MLKKFYILLSLIFIFLLIKETLCSIKTIETIQNIDFSYKKNIEITCEIKKSIFNKNLNGKIFIKENKFRLFLYNNSILVLDSGCNERYFWYWSLHESKDTLFYCNIKHVDNVLRSGYKPTWMLKIFKKIGNIGEKYNLTENNRIVSIAEIIPGGVAYNIVDEGIIIKVEIKNALNENFDESVLNIPTNFNVFNEMIPISQSIF